MMVEEGCLSVPGIWEEIERPDECIVKFVNRNGQKEEKKCEGLLATVIQHEMDHPTGSVLGKCSVLQLWQTLLYPASLYKLIPPITPQWL